MKADDHEKDQEFKRRLDHLIEMREAVKAGEPAQIEYEKALEEFNKIADEI